MWNDEKVLSIGAKRILIYLLSVVVSIILFYVTFNFIIPTDASTQIYIQATAVLLTIVGHIINITNKLMSKQLSADVRVSLDTAVVNKDVVISCTVENKGFDHIDNMFFYLFIDQPVLNKTTHLYEYNHVLKHGHDYQRCTYKTFCALSEACSYHSIHEYPIELKASSQVNDFYGFKELDFLSNSSVMYINSGEHFTEDVSFHLEKGVYRAILVGRFGNYKKDCLCANKQFIIK